MTFFFYLKQDKLVRVTGKDGFYAPLKQHGLGFQKNILENKSPGDFNDMLKKNKSEWHRNTAKIKSWLEELK